MGGMRVSQNGLGWGGWEILRNNGGDAKKGGDDLRIGGMAFLLTMFFEKLDMQGALPIISVCFTSELSRLLLSSVFSVKYCFGSLHNPKNSALQTIYLCFSLLWVAKTLVFFPCRLMGGCTFLEIGGDTKNGGDELRMGGMKVVAHYEWEAGLIGAGVFW